MPKKKRKKSGYAGSYSVYDESKTNDTPTVLGIIENYLISRLGKPEGTGIPAIRYDRNFKMEWVV